MNKLSKILNILDEHQAINTIDFCVKEMTTLADHMIICEGRSQKHMQTLAEKIECDLELKKNYHPNLSDKTDHEWIIVDHGDIIIHILSKEGRALYELEKLWGSDY